MPSHEERVKKHYEDLCDKCLRDPHSFTWMGANLCRKCMTTLKEPTFRGRERDTNQRR